MVTPVRCWLIVLLLLAASSASAQQTIINVPSDTLTPRGEHFLLHESQMTPISAKETYTTTNFYTYGLTDHVELAATIYGVDNVNSQFSTLGLGYKSVHEIFATPRRSSKSNGRPDSCCRSR